MENENDSTTTSTEQVEEKVEQPQFVTKEDLSGLLKEALDPINSDLGSLKRTVKKSSKTTEKTEETPEQKGTTELSSLQERLDRMALTSVGITHEDDLKLAQETAQKWNQGIEDIVTDEDFLAKLERQRTARSNADATTDIKGDKGGGGTNAKLSADYWISKGAPPTATDIPDKQARVKVIREMMKSSTQGKTFYNY